MARTLVVGRFSRSRQGYGFVRPADARPADRDSDIRVPLVASADAADGDTVRVKITKERHVGRPGLSGEVVEVIQRRTTRFVGTAFQSAEEHWVQLDGTQFPRPIWVGDPSAKGVRDDDKVIVELIRFPSPLQDGEGVIVEVLGAFDAPGVDTQTVVAEFGLPGPFPEQVLEDARRQADTFSSSVPAGRQDLTDEIIVTIDPKDARDFDDAISLTRLERGHWLLGVHIADVAHFVQKGSALDQEALARGTSVYLPDQVIPMLPEIVSNNLASLQPDRLRLARTCWIEFSEDGVPVHTEVQRTVIKSCRRFTYEEVDVFLADQSTKEIAMKASVRELLGRMQRLASILRDRRLTRGALELNMPEVKIDLDRSGRVAGAHVVENTESHQIVEEFMLAANEAVAEKIAAAKGKFLRRVHPSPDLRKLRQLTEFVLELGFEVESLESRFELQRLLGLARHQPEEHAVHYAVLRSLSRAVYAPLDEGHYALASDCYCHFTSPIRRYPDLTIHRALDFLDAGKRPPDDHLEQLGEHCSELERRAEAAERELIKLKLLHFLSSRVGMELDGVVTGVARFGIFVQGIHLPAEGLIETEELPTDQYRFDRSSHTLSGHRPGNIYRLGDQIRVCVREVDLGKRNLLFAPALGNNESRRKQKSRRLASSRRSHSRGGKKSVRQTERQRKSHAENGSKSANQKKATNKGTRRKKSKRHKSR